MRPESRLILGNMPVKPNGEAVVCKTIDTRFNSENGLHFNGQRASLVIQRSPEERENSVRFRGCPPLNNENLFKSM